MHSFLYDISWVEPLRSPLLTHLFQGFTALGHTQILMLILPIGYWLMSRPMFFRLTLLVLVSALLNALLKDLWQDPRPAGLHLDTSVAGTWGLPSGHAQIAIVLWGWLAWEVNRRWCWWLCGTLIAGITFSRIYLGVHDVEDLLVGLLLGAFTLLLYARIRHIAFWRRENVVAHLLLISAATLLFWRWWPQGGTSPALKLGGLAAGAVFGAWSEWRNAGEAEARGWGMRLLFTALAVAGLVLLQVLLGWFPKTDASVLLGSLLTGCYITRVAPRLWRLATRPLALGQRV